MLRWKPSLAKQIAESKQVCFIYCFIFCREDWVNSTEFVSTTRGPQCCLWSKANLILILSWVLCGVWLNWKLASSLSVPFFKFIFWQNGNNSHVLLFEAMLLRVGTLTGAISSPWVWTEISLKWMPHTSQIWELMMEKSYFDKNRSCCIVIAHVTSTRDTLDNCWTNNWRPNKRLLRASKLCQILPFFCC